MEATRAIVPACVGGMQSSGTQYDAADISYIYIHVYDFSIVTILLIQILIMVLHIMILTIILLPLLIIYAVCCTPPCQHARTHQCVRASRRAGTRACVLAGMQARRHADTLACRHMGVQVHGYMAYVLESVCAHLSVRARTSCHVQVCAHA